MSDGLTAVLGRISEIRSALGVSSGGVLGVRSSSSADGFEQMLRDAASSKAAKAGRTASSSRNGSDPLERSAIPNKGAKTGLAKGSGAANSASWPSGVPEEAEEYADAFAAASAETGVPLRILLAVAWAESAFQPGAESGVGAQGMMQLMPGTAAGLGVDPSDPVQNIMGGARYLAAQYEAFGSWDLAFAAYNAGPGAVQKYGGIPPYSETQNYVQIINSYLERIGEGVPTAAATLVNQSAEVTSMLTPVPVGNDLTAPGGAVTSMLAPVPVGSDLTAPGGSESAALARTRLVESVLADVEARRSAFPTAPVSVPALVADALGAVAAPGGSAGSVPGSVATANGNSSITAVAGGVAAAANAETAPTTPAPTTLGATTLAALPEQLLAQVQRTRADGQTTHRLVVRLDPPELGSVSVSFELKGSEVNVIVRPERPESSPLLADSRNRIATLLAREGLQLSGFDVSTAGQERQQPRSWTTATRSVTPIDLDTTDVALTVDRGLRL